MSVPCIVTKPVAGLATTAAPCVTDRATSISSNWMKNHTDKDRLLLKPTVSAVSDMTQRCIYAPVTLLLLRVAG